MCYEGQEGEIGFGGQRHEPAALPPGKVPDTNCTGGCVSLRAWKYCPHRDLVPWQFSL